MSTCYLCCHEEIKKVLLLIEKSILSGDAVNSKNQTSLHVHALWSCSLLFLYLAGECIWTGASGKDPERQQCQKLWCLLMAFIAIKCAFHPRSINIFLLGNMGCGYSTYVFMEK